MTLLAALLGPLQLLLGTFFLGHAGWRGAALFPHARRSLAERMVIATTLATWMAIASVAAVGAVGWLRPSVLLVIAGALWLASLRLADPVPLSWSWRRLGVFWPLIFPAVLLVLDGTILIGLAPDKWDAMTYHLYFPVRWLQEGRLFQIPSFADETILYSPHNGALLFTWQMALLGSDATTDVCQLWLLAALSLASYRLALLLGWRRRAAAFAASLPHLLEAFHTWALAAHVDLFMAAFLVIGCAWLAAGLARGDGRRVLLAGLALGLALGSKTVAIPLAALALAPAVAVLAWRRRPLEIAGVGAALALGGGFWLVANLVLYGNPLFPLDLTLPFWHFEGIYDRSELAEGSLFRVRELGAWSSVVFAKDGVAPWVLAALGLVGWLSAGRRHPWLAFAGAAYIVASAACVFALVPHNTQSRFLLPTLALALTGVAACGRWRRPWTWRWGPVPAIVVAITALHVVLLFELAPWEPWRRAHAIWNAVGAGDALWATPTLWALAAGLVPLAVRHRRQRPLAGALAGLVLVAVAGGLALAIVRSEASRPLLLASSPPYGKLAPGFTPFHRPQLAPQRIAYTGFNLPYMLVGPQFRHTVVYCNVQGDPDDSVFEFWDRDRTQRREGLYREKADFATWLACLDERRIDYVAVSIILVAKRNPAWSYDERFPIERAWLRHHPEIFEPVVVHDLIEVYRRRHP